MNGREGTVFDDAVIAYVDRWRDPSGDDQEEIGELLARLGPLLLGERDLLADTVRAACERDPAIGAQLWTLCEEHGAQVTAIDRAQVSPSDGADSDGADAFSPTHVITGFVDGEVREEGADVIAYLDRWRASGSDPEEIDELLARLGQLLLGERDLLIDAIRAACERYPAGAHLWAACEEHLGNVAERDRDDDDDDDDNDEVDEDDDQTVDENDEVDEDDDQTVDDDENDDEADDDEVVNDDEGAATLGNVINLAKYRHARSRHRRP
jgi:hypothetical protein